jgi:hypothetical protein
MKSFTEVREIIDRIAYAREKLDDFSHDKTPFGQNSQRAITVTSLIERGINECERVIESEVMVNAENQFEKTALIGLLDNNIFKCSAGILALKENVIGYILPDLPDTDKRKYL